MSGNPGRFFPHTLMERFGGLSRDRKASLFTDNSKLRQNVYISDSLWNAVVSNPLQLMNRFGICDGSKTIPFQNGSSKYYSFVMCPIEMKIGDFDQSPVFCCGNYRQQVCCDKKKFDVEIENVLPPPIPSVGVFCILAIILALLLVAAGYIFVHVFHKRSKTLAARPLRSGINSQAAVVSHAESHTLLSAGRGALASSRGNLSNFGSPLSFAASSQSLSLPRPNSKAGSNLHNADTVVGRQTPGSKSLHSRKDTDI